MEASKSPSLTRTIIIYGRKNGFVHKATNPKYLEILDKGLFVRMKIISESVENGIVIPKGLPQKDPSEFSDTKKETVALDISI